MKINVVKKSAVEDIIIRLTFDGAFQRSKIYKDHCTDADRAAFRKSIVENLQITLAAILAKEGYSSEDHCKTILKFSNAISKKHSAILKGNKLRIGNAQKFLNLYWKISWLLKKDIRTPIHCPFDSVVIKKLDIGVRGILWTKFDSIQEYKQLVKAAATCTGPDRSIAEWELEEYRKLINYDN